MTGNQGVVSTHCRASLICVGLGPSHVVVVVAQNVESVHENKGKRQLLCQSGE